MASAAIGEADPEVLSRDYHLYAPARALLDGVQADDDASANELMMIARLRASRLLKDRTIGLDEARMFTGRILQAGRPALLRFEEMMREGKTPTEFLQ